MKLRLLPLLAAVLLGTLLVPPAGAAGGGTAGTDPCGDTEAMVRAAQQSVQPPGGRNASFDIRGYGVADIVEGERAVGTTVTLEMCGDVPAAELPGTGLSVSWDLPGSCQGSVLVGDAAVRPPAGPARVATLNKSCTRTSQGPLNGISSTTYSVYSVDLPASAWRVEGARITWDLRRDAGLGEAAEQVVAGTLWGDLGARARDGRQVTLLDTNGVRVTGPGTEDAADGAGDHRIG